MKFRSLGYRLALYGLAGFVLCSRSCIRQDEFSCEEAVQHLQDCCAPSTVVTQVDCTYDPGTSCNPPSYPWPPVAVSLCIQNASCAELLSSGSCGGLEGPLGRYDRSDCLCGKGAALPLSFSARGCPALQVPVVCSLTGCDLQSQRRLSSCVAGLSNCSAGEEAIFLAGLQACFAGLPAACGVLLPTLPEVDAGATPDLGAAR